jgi:hypothetical protein
MGTFPGGRTQPIFTNPTLLEKLLDRDSNPYAESPPNSAAVTRFNGTGYWSITWFNIGELTL